MTQNASRLTVKPGETAPDFHFLIDRAGVVRWVQIETPIDDLSRYGVFPTEDEILGAVRAGKS